MNDDPTAAGIVVAQFKVTLEDPAPPSVNEMYSTGHGGKRFLTKAGEKFKSALSAAVVGVTSMMDWKAAVDEVYTHRGYAGISIGVYFEEIYNPAWKPGGITKPSPKFPKGNLQLPYQKKDAGSYDKIIQDAVAIGTGIDDAVTLWSSIYKARDAKRPRVEIHYLIYRGDVGH